MAIIEPRDSEERVMRSFRFKKSLDRKVIDLTEKNRRIQDLCTIKPPGGNRKRRREIIYLNPNNFQLITVQ